MSNTRNLGELLQADGEVPSSKIDSVAATKLTGTVADARLSSTRQAAKLTLSGGAMTGAITTNSTFDGRDVSVDGTKLDGIESGATADQTAAEILAALLTVDGDGSGLDADAVDGYSAAEILDAAANNAQSLVGAGDVTITANNGLIGVAEFNVNTSNTEKALKEALRVTKDGGRIVVAEFSHPVNPVFKKIYLNYLMKALPVIVKKISINPDAYIYLAESIRAWPDQAELASIMRDSGFKSVAWQDLTFGIVAVHIGYKG